MEFQNLIESRRSVRKYADKEVTREQVEEIIKAAQEAPSWKNQQTSKYYCVLSKEKREEIRTTCFPSFNEQRSLNAALIVTAYEKTMLALMITVSLSTNWAMAGAVMTSVFRI